jgi:hypothetical protein
MTHAAAGTKCNCNQRGWMPGIEHRPIQWTRPDYMIRDAGKMRPHVVVDHIMQGYLTTIDAWAANGQSKIITHFGISRTGRVCQYQDIYTEGVHTTSVSSPTAARVIQYGSVAGRGVNPYSIAIEHEGFSVDPGYGHDYIYTTARPWPEAMVLASIAVKRWIFAAPDTNLGAPSVDSIIGHYEADARSRINDPCPQTDRSLWPRARMIAALAPPPAAPALDRATVLGLVDAITRDSVTARDAVARIEANAANLRRHMEVTR